MRLKQSFLFMLLALFFARVVVAEEVSCSLEEKFDDGGSRGLEVKLTIEKDVVVGISHNNYFASGEEGGAYSCTFDASSTDKKSIWTPKKNEVDVRLPAEDQPDDDSIFHISRTKNGYLVTYEKMSRYYCGFGAEFPDTVEIIKGEQHCIAEYP